MFCVILSLIFVMAGTYLLSMSLFGQTTKRLINFDYKELPWYLKIIIYVFGYKKDFLNKTLWAPDYLPSHHNFVLKDKLRIIAPFLGFLFIVAGAILSII